MKVLIIALGLVFSLGYAQAEAPDTLPAVYLALDGTGSLNKPSPINPAISQRQVLQSLMPELYGAFRNWHEGTRVNLFVVCHKPILALQTGTGRAAMPEVMHGIEQIEQNCTQKGTRIDLTFEAIQRLHVGTNPYAIILLTDGISETEERINIDDAVSALATLAEKPPALFAMIGVNEEYVIDWLSHSQSIFGDTRIVIGSPRDIASTVDRIKTALQ